jgi:hypothetical protein
MLGSLWGLNGMLLRLYLELFQDDISRSCACFGVPRPID